MRSHGGDPAATQQRFLEAGQPTQHTRNNLGLRRPDTRPPPRRRRLQQQALRHADVRVRVEEVEEDGEHRARRVHPEGHPPQELLVEALLEVLEYD